MTKLKTFFKKKDIIISFDRYALDAVGAMALGLFSSLLVGTILNTLGEQLISFLGEADIFSLILQMGKFAMAATGPAMAISIGYALKAPQLVLFSLCAVGMSANTLGGGGGPLAVLIITIIATEFGKLVSKETKIDILVTPIVTLAIGIGLSIWWAPAIGYTASAFGSAIIWAATMQPIIMGIIVSVLVGIALTLPISSAAICAALGLVGLAGGAALAGCCAQMVGFAVLSYKENKIGGVIAQGLGTSMLQFHNILKNPRVWIIPILVSAITGPLATTIFKLEMNGSPISSGMGTCGMVGPIGVITGWLSPVQPAFDLGKQAITPGIWEWFSLLMICIILPAVITYFLGGIFRKKGYIKDGDLKLKL